jgi:hypothetical protein
MKSVSSTEIRIPSNLAIPLKEAVLSSKRRESVVIGLASHTYLRDKALLLVRKIILMPDDAYIVTSTHGAKWHGSAMLSTLNKALEEDLGLVLFHSHSHSGVVRLSDDDRYSAGELLPVFQNLIPLRPHASVVFGQDHSAGLVLLPDTDDLKKNVKIRWLGKTTVDFLEEETVPSYEVAEDLFHRQILLIGSEGQLKLKQAKVAVVGLGGGGSHVVQQLTHMGVGEIVGIDSDRADKTNRHRLIGMFWWDAILKRKKTDIMARMVRLINRRVKFVRVPYTIPDQRAIDAIKEVDVVVGCLDNLQARADLQELAWRYLIPYVDVGVLITPNQDKKEVLIGGNVTTLIPGEFCLWCTGSLSEEKLLSETGGRPRSYFQGTDKQAQVVSFNGVLASQAVNEVLQLLTGFVSPSEDMSIKKFNGLEGTLERWEVRKKAECSKCQSFLAVGDVIWRNA